MEKATIVYGPRSSGKSTLIEKMMKDYKNPLHTDYNHFIRGSILSSYMGVEKHTDVIAIEMPVLTGKQFLFEDFFNLIGGKMEVHQKGKHPFTMDTPKLIFEINEKPTFHGLSEGFVNSKFEFIECSEIEIHNRVVYKAPEELPFSTCKICGCTDNNACIHPEKENCHWVDADHTLCSHCLDKLIEKAAKYDSIEASIATFYENEEDETDLCDIGEFIASYFDFL
jgi:hypothetical protein